MAGRWFFHKTQTEKTIKFGIVGANPTRSIYRAPRPTRHLPTQCRPGWLCNERGKERVRLGRKHLLARPSQGLQQKQPQSVVAQLLPSVPVGGSGNAATAFEQITDNLTIGNNEFLIGVSEVRRVHIEDTGVIALERTRCTQSIEGTRLVTLYWAIYDAAEKTLRMARIRAEGEAELRTYRTQVADFLRRWTASVSVSAAQKNIVLR